MLNLSDIEREIYTLENGTITYPVCEKLSVLYTILEHHEEERPEVVHAERYSLASAPTSEFLDKVNGAPVDEVLQIIDRHMECVKVLYPKEYAAIMRQIEELL